MEITRPVLRWHGGKWMLAPWVMSFFPKHRVYVEPFGGAASILLRKERSYAEVYNDLDANVVNLFRVLRDEAAAARLRDLLELTPFARIEFVEAYEGAEDPVEAARRLIVRAFMGHGSDSATGSVTSFRSNSNRLGTTPAHDWVNYPQALPIAIERLRGVIVEQRDALDVMRQHDGPTTLHYVDPPYVHSTRTWVTSGKGKGNYRHEMTDTDHRRLLRGLKALEGMVVLSGYPSALYDKALKGWYHHETPAIADGGRKRTEVVWLNRACAVALEAERAQKDLFSSFREAAE